MSDFVKLHTEALDNPKIDAIPDHLVKPWLKLLLISRLYGGGLPDLKTLSFRLRVDQVTAAAWLVALERLRLIDAPDESGESRMHDWEDWNPPNPVDRTNVERQRRFRSKNRNAVTGVSPIPPSPEIQKTNCNLTKGVTPLRNGTVTPLRNAVTICTNKVTENPPPPQSAAGDAWPLADAWLAEHYPRCDVAMRAHIIACGVQAHISASRNGTALTDAILTRCLDTASVPQQTSAALFLKTLPTVVKNQLQAYERKCK